jgi:spore germination cell wall hydrolase CwlJ-like protein
MIYHHLAAFDPKDGIELFDQPPEFLYAVTVWGEARGRTLTEKQAVAAVILNRARKPFLPSGQPMWWMSAPQANLLGRVASVVTHPWQFSCFNASDPNRDKLPYAPEKEPEAWRECVAVCAGMLDGLLSDPTNSADHYHSYSLGDFALGKWPSWAKVGRECAVLGRFRFYRLA